MTFAAKWVIVALLATLAGPAVASAAWVETHQRAVPGNGVATCLRSATPGLVSTLGPIGRRTVATDVLRVGSGASGFAFAERARLGHLLDCAAVATNGATTAYAGDVFVKDRSVVRAVVSGPGGTTTTDLASAPVSSVTALTAAVSPRGDVVVAWGVRFGGFASRRARTRISAARLLPGGRFSAVEVVSDWRPASGFGAVDLAAAVDGAGRTTLAWGRSIRDRGRYEDLATVESRVANPGQPFGAVQVLTPAAQSFLGVRPALAVNADGSALLAFAGNGAVWVHERPAGSERFGPATPFAHGGFVEYQRPVVALRPDGAAVVAWRSDPGDEQGGVDIATRTRPGPFGKPVTIKRPRNLGGGGFQFGVEAGNRPSAPMDEAGRELRVALAKDGRVVLTWVEPLGVRDGDRLLRPRVALGSLGARRFAVRTLGTPCRSTNGAKPVLAADGSPAIAWTDNDTHGELGAGTAEFPAANGRMHIAALAPAAKRAPAPRLNVRARPQRLHYSQPLRLSVRCNGPCFLRGVIRARPKSDRVPGDKVSPSADEPHAFGTATLSRRGTARLDIGPTVREHIARRGGGPVRVAVHACRPGSGAMSRRIVRVRVARQPLPLLRVPIAVRARRVGSRIVVRWRTDGPARRMSFLLEGRRTKRVRKFDGDLYGTDFLAGHGRRSFVSRMKPEEPQRVRWVSVEAIPDDPVQKSRRVLVKVRQGKSG